MIKFEKQTEELYVQLTCDNCQVSNNYLCANYTEVFQVMTKYGWETESPIGTNILHFCPDCVKDF